MTDTIQEAVGLVRKYVDHPYTSPDTLVLDSDLVRINADNLASLVQHIDAQDAKIKALVEALEGMRELVREEEFCLCEYKDNTTPADQGPEIDAADAALAAAKETTA